MLLFSDTILSFIKRCEKIAKEILQNEMGAIPRRTRFLYNNYTYPLHIVVFEKKNQLGFFDHHSYQIGIHKSLMYTAKAQTLRNLIRHELAHYFCFIEFGLTEHAHGIEFKSICERFNWNKDISAATVDLSETNESQEGDLKSEKIIERVKKLLSLAASANPHEAELATLKANQLLLKHNLSFSGDSTDDEELVVEKVCEQKRRNSKLQCIYHILQSFMVRPVFNYGRGKVYIEVTGTKSNVSMAQYVSDFLSHELDRLWSEVKGANPELRGTKHKNSFLSGLSEGYKSKIKSSINSFSQEEKLALVKLERDLDLKIKKFYRGLQSTSFNSSRDSRSHSLGVEAGRKLAIHRGVKDKSSTRLHLLN